MPSLQSQVNKAIFGNYDAYTGFNSDRYRADRQGWNSNHFFLADSLVSDRPRIVVEIGVWKGGSTIHMAETLKSNDIDGVIISVDTFLGSWEHYEQPDYFPSLMMEHGYPTLFKTFLTNVVEAGVKDYVLPLPLDSANAAHVLNRKGIRPDVIHIDAGHDYEAVLNDLRLWWPILQPGGVLIADDYDVKGEVWPSVRAAVDEFLLATPHVDFEAVPYKARFRKRV